MIVWTVPCWSRWMDDPERTDRPAEKFYCGKDRAEQECTKCAGNPQRCMAKLDPIGPMIKLRVEIVKEGER